MLSERVKEWTKDWKQQGIAEGLQEGLQKGLQEGLQEGLKKGRLEGEAEFLQYLLEQRFGSGAISEAVRKRIEAADTHTLQRWGKQILTAQTIEEVFEA